MKIDIPYLYIPHGTFLVSRVKGRKTMPSKEAVARRNGAYDVR